MMNLTILIYIIIISYISREINTQTTNSIDLSFIIEPHDDVISRDSHVTLRCLFNRNDVTYSWLYRPLFQGQEVEVMTSAFRSSANDGTLTLQWDPSSQGRYRCHVTIPGHGSLVTREATVQLAKLDVEKLDPQRSGEGEYFLGDVVLLNCHVQAIPEDKVSREWFSVPMDGGLMQPCINGSADFLYHNRGRTLEIRKLHKDLFIRYYCGVVSKLPSSDASVTGDYISVTQKTPVEGAHQLQFASLPQRDTVWTLAGSTITLVCAANGRTKQGTSPRIMWLKGDKIIKVGSESRLSLVGQGSLRIEGAQDFDAGRYTCRVSLVEARADKFAEILLNVGQAPLIKTLASHNVLGYVKKELVLPCPVAGNPPPSVEWRKNGESLVSSEYIHQTATSLRISGLEPGDTGLFQCLVSNRFGSAQSSIQLRVISSQGSPLHDQVYTAPNAYSVNNTAQVIPQPPSNLKVQLGSDYIHVTWLPPPGNVAAYRVQLVKDGESRDISKKTVNTGEMINYLQPDTEYEVRVFSIFVDGTLSREPAFLKVRTAPIVLRYPSVRNLMANVIGFGTLNISWNHAIKGFSHLDKYEVLLYNLSETDQALAAVPVNTSVPASETSILVSGLRPDAFYRIYVLGVGRGLRGIYNDVTSPRVPSRTPSAPPTEVGIKKVGANVATVHWRAPPYDARNGEIIAYLITVAASDWSEPQTFKVNNVYKHKIRDLTRNTFYSVTVAAFTRAGIGPSSSPVSFRTQMNPTAADVSVGAQVGSPSDDNLLDEQKRPTAVRDLKAESLDGEIRLSWLPPEAGVRVRNYTIKWGRTYPGPSEHILDGAARAYTIKGTELMVNYIFQVTPVNNKGEGLPTMIHVLTKSNTPDAAFSIPMNLEVPSVGPTWAVLKWEDPDLTADSSDGRIYEVKYGPVREYLGGKMFLNSSSLTIRLDNLHPANMYEFVVRAISPSKPQLSSTYSMVQSFTTKGQKPSDSPKDLTLSAVRGQINSVQVSWQPPNFPNGKIIAYIVLLRTFVRGDSDDKWVDRRITGEYVNTVINNLQPSSIYLFKIKCENEHGVSPVSPIRVYKTPDVSGANGGPVILSSDITDASKIVGPLIPASTDPGAPLSPPEIREGGKDDHWWILIGSVVGVAMILLTITLIVHRFCCRKNLAHSGYRPGKPSTNGNGAQNKGVISSLDGKVTPVLNDGRGQKPPDLFINTDGQLIEMDRRNSDSMGGPSDADNDSVRFTSVSQRHLSDGPGFSPGSSSGGGGLPSGSGGLPFAHHMPRMMGPSPNYYPQTMMHPHMGMMGMHNPSPPGELNSNRNSQLSHHHQRMSSLGQSGKPKSSPMMQMSAPGHHDNTQGMGMNFSGAPMNSMGREMMPLSLPPTGRPPHHAPMRIGPPPPRVNASELASHTSSEDIRPLMQASTLSEGNNKSPGGQQQHSTVPQVVNPNSAGVQRRGSSSHMKRKPGLGNPALNNTIKQHSGIDRSPGSATSSESDLVKGFSAEELTQEMADLEGLMKDLNTITQKEFEC